MTHDIDEILIADGEFQGAVAEVSDIDDTIVLTDQALKAATKAELGIEMSRAEVRKLPKDVKRKFLRIAYDKYTDLLVPNEHWITTFNAKQTNPTHIGIILSARTQTIRKPTEELLKRLNVSFQYLVLSPPIMAHDEEFKAESILELSKAFKEVKYYEDKLENLEYILRQYPELCGKKIKLFLVDSTTVREISSH
jgi:hypothetical protein